MLASLKIIRAFVQMRKVFKDHAFIFQKLDKFELKQIEADQKFEQIFKALESKDKQPEIGIFFEGQIFDAYTFVKLLKILTAIISKIKHKKIFTTESTEVTEMKKSYYLVSD